MRTTQKNYLIALANVQKFQVRIAKDPNNYFDNHKGVDIYWMCTDICAQTPFFMNDGLSQLFNQLHKNDWINFACTPANTRYHFKFTPKSQISLTPAGKQELKRLEQPSVAS